MIVIDINGSYESIPSSHSLKRRLGELLTIRVQMSDPDGAPEPATVQALIDGFTKMRRNVLRRRFAGLILLCLLSAFAWLILSAQSEGSKADRAGHQLALEQAETKLAVIQKAIHDEQTAFADLDAANAVRKAAEMTSKEKSAKLPAIEKDAAAQEAIVRTTPREVPARTGPMRGRLGGGSVRVPMKPNPDLPPAEAKLAECREKLTQAIQEDNAAKVRLEQAIATQAAAQARLNAARKRRQEPPGDVQQLEVEIERLRTLLEAGRKK